MSPQDGACEKLRNYVYICQSYGMQKKLWPLFFRTRCIIVGLLIKILALNCSCIVTLCDYFNATNDTNGGAVNAGRENDGREIDGPMCRA